MAFAPKLQGRSVQKTIVKRSFVWNPCSLAAPVVLLLTLTHYAAADSFRVVLSLPEAPQTAFIVNGPQGVALVGSSLYALGGSGPQHGGTIIGVNTDGSNFRTVHQFSSTGDWSPSSALVAFGGKLYGTTFEVGNRTTHGGSVFSLNADGSGFQTLRSFSFFGAYEPQSRLLVDASGVYGTTSGSSSSDGRQASPSLFHIDPQKSANNWETHPANFTPPFSAMTRAPGNSVLYGPGFLFGSQLAFAINSDGTNFHRLAFASQTRMAIDSSGNVLYGIGYDDVLFAAGTHDSQFHALHTFTGGVGGVRLINNQLLVGTTRNDGAFNKGTVWSLNFGDGQFRILHSFAGGADGLQPSEELEFDGLSTLYGLAAGGATGNGVIFALAVPEPSCFVLAALGLMFFIVSAGNRVRRPQC